ncbi:hypothetical protein A4X06_0g9701 [Tilletia controversa]|uniref:Uncharacterized protein n=3 Tax=Tilletia TaxID=13289 RepID=A0A8X7MI51_9BASI|nr:hypothetical protein A4X06_0g9701 [Tilletia controversa]KAE8236656.1 hypothetical protein A4X03_0g9369 [Tilletia caries]
MSRKTRHSIDYLPARGSRDAPSRFRGDGDALRSFLSDVEDLLDSYGIDNKKVHAEAIFRYCSSSVRMLLEELPSYRRQDVKAMIKDLKKHFPPRKQASRYRRSDLEDLVDEYSHEDITIDTLEAFIKYKSRFDRIGFCLLDHGKIDRFLLDKAFWDGIPETLQDRLQEEGLLKIESPFAPSSLQVTVAAQTHFTLATHSIASFGGINHLGVQHTRLGRNWFVWLAFGLVAIVGAFVALTRGRLEDHVAR